MAVYKIFPEKDATIYSLFPNMNTGMEEMIEATILVEDFKDLIGEIDEETGMTHDTSFMDGHLEKISSSSFNF